MGETMMGLTFEQLRAANVARLPLFKNRRGEPAHSAPDGSDWKLSAWCNAVLGELGELANLIKKIERGDMVLDDARGDVADEIADVQTYLDLLAFRCGVNLSAATVAKFNRVSDRVGCDVRIYPSSPPRDEVVEALRDLRLSARLLHQNAVACVEHHHGSTPSKTGWLADCLKRIERAEAALAKMESSHG